MCGGVVRWRLCAAGERRRRQLPRRGRQPAVGLHERLFPPTVSAALRRVVAGGARASRRRHPHGHDQSSGAGHAASWQRRGAGRGQARLQGLSPAPGNYTARTHHRRRLQQGNGGDCLRRKTPLGRRPVRNWIRRTISSLFLCRKIHLFLGKRTKTTAIRAAVFDSNMHQIVCRLGRIL